MAKQVDLMEGKLEMLIPKSTQMRLSLLSWPFRFMRTSTSSTLRPNKEASQSSTGSRSWSHDAAGVSSAPTPPSAVCRAG
jgi:hypothetical protein